MWEYKGVEYSNAYVSHGRTKGSKNGISTTAGYKAIGNKAVGTFDPTTGRYIYDTAKNVINTISNAGYNVGYKVGSAIENGINAVRNGISSLTNRNNAKTTQTQSNVDGATVRTGTNTFTFSGNANNAKTPDGSSKKPIESEEDALIKKQQETYANRAAKREEEAAAASKSAHGEQYRNSIAEKEAKAEQDALIKKQQETYANRAAKREEEAAKAEEDRLIKKQQETYANRDAKREEEALIKKQQETYANRAAERKAKAEEDALIKKQQETYAKRAAERKKEADRQIAKEARGFDPEEEKAKAEAKEERVREASNNTGEYAQKVSTLIDDYSKKDSLTRKESQEFYTAVEDYSYAKSEELIARGWTDEQICNYWNGRLKDLKSGEVFNSRESDWDMHKSVQNSVVSQRDRFKR